MTEAWIAEVMSRVVSGTVSRLMSIKVRDAFISSYLFISLLSVSFQHSQ